jgi:hypothetical protein
MLQSVTRGASYGLNLRDDLRRFLCGLGSAFDFGDGFFGQPFFVAADVFVIIFIFIFGFGRDRLACVGFFCFFFLKILSAPWVLAERGLIYGAGIDYYARFYCGFEVDAAQVRGCGLQGVEQEAGGFRVHLSAEDQAHDLHE